MRFGLNEQESLKYIELQTGRIITGRHYYRIKKYLQSDPSISMWLDSFAKVGWAVAHRDRIEEIEKLMQSTWKMLTAEQSKPESEQNKRLILSIMGELREQNKRLTELSLATPIVSSIKSIIANAELQGNTLDYKDVIESSNDNTRRVSTPQAHSASRNKEERVF